MKTKNADINKHPIRTETLTIKGREYIRYVLDLGYDKGKRIRRTFKSMIEAQAELNNHLTLTEKIGKAAKRLTDDQLSDAATAFDKLAGTTTLTQAVDFLLTYGEYADILNDALKAHRQLAGRAALSEAVDYYLAQKHPVDGVSLTCSELLQIYLKKARNRRPSTLQELVTKTKPFMVKFGEVPVVDVTGNMLHDWHSELTGKPATLNKYRTLISSLFNLAVTLKAIKENPAKGLNIDKVPKPKPYVMPVADVIKIMEWSSANSPEMVPYYAIAILAGIRPDGELKRLDWSDINFKSKEIYIHTEVSKTGADRFVPMSDNLLKWLVPYRKKKGLVFYSRRRFRDMQTGSGIAYHADMFRHTYASYHIAEYGNALQTAENMGHQTTTTVYKHYRRAVSKEDAARFWAIVPKQESNVISIEGAA